MNRITTVVFQVLHIPATFFLFKAPFTQDHNCSYIFHNIFCSTPRICPSARFRLGKIHKSCPSSLAWIGCCANFRKNSPFLSRTSSILSNRAFSKTIASFILNRAIVIMTKMKMMRRNAISTICKKSRYYNMIFLIKELHVSVVLPPDMSLLLGSDPEGPLQRPTNCSSFPRPPYPVSSSSWPAARPLHHPASCGRPSSRLRS